MDPAGPAVLIDFHPIWQPWPFDAAYPQVINSVDRRRPGYTGLIHKMAVSRLLRGLAVPEETDLDRMATLALGWFAIRWWDAEKGAHFPDYLKATEAYVAASASLAR